jgi:hypothetical protein
MKGDTQKPFFGIGQDFKFSDEARCLGAEIDPFECAGFFSKR